MVDAPIFSFAFDLGRLIDFQGKWFHLLGGKSLRLDGHSISADGQESKGVHAGGVGLRGGFDCGCSILGDDFRSHHNGAAGIGDDPVIEPVTVCPSADARHSSTDTRPIPTM